MSNNGEKRRPIWRDKETGSIKIIDQRRLPHELIVVDLQLVNDCITAIQDMYVRGAPLIGVTGAYGVYLAVLNFPTQEIEADYLISECRRIKAARPTAVNLSWAVDRVYDKLKHISNKDQAISVAQQEADLIAELEAENCRKIGAHGLPVIRNISREKDGRTVNVLTHCNAGWLACVEYGTATAPIYAAFDAGIDVHVWVDETRPLNQGARLTAWELGQRGVKHTLITDNAGGHLMQHAKVDLVIVGTDRTTFTGDVANKIGTYLKALAAKDNQIPFYVALPSSTFDWHINDGVKDIPIEERDPNEIKFVQGRKAGKTLSVLISPADSPAANFAFDVTPARLVTGFITERGICKASAQDIKQLFPEKSKR